MIFTFPYSTVVDVHDGDTIKVDIDLGFFTWQRGWRVRFARINAPELKTPEGQDALAFLLEKVGVGDTVTVVSKGLDNYGRILGEIETADGTNLSDYMLSGGHAVAYP